MIKVLVCGKFDILHEGHLNILENAKSLGDKLFVAVSTDELIMERENKKPAKDFLTRYRLIKALKCVDVVIPQYEKDKSNMIRKMGIDIVVVGDDWWDKDFKATGAEVIFFPYTRGISSSEIKNRIKNEK